MGKEKGKKGVANKHLHARIAYLERASKYLTDQAEATSTTSAAGNAPRQPSPNHAKSQGELMDVEGTDQPSAGPEHIHDQATDSRRNLPFVHLRAGGLPILYTSQLQSIARKGQIRLSQDVKHGICKTCSAPLIEGTSATRFTENLSKGGCKPWAEVLVVKCNACETVKRFPVGARRQRRKQDRKAELGTYRDDDAAGTNGDGAGATASGAMEVAVPPVKGGG